MMKACVVVLFSLLVLCDLVYSAPHCGDNGIQDSYASQYCNCFSGYAPSSSAQTDCDVSAWCPYNEPTDTRTTVGGFQPTLFNASFKADRYNTVIRIPLVVGRRTTQVRFVGGSNTCGYPGNLWAKRVNGLDCFDELYGSLPWSSNSLCGFTKSVSGAKTTYSATLMVSYEDTLKDAQGAFTHTGNVKMKVSVTFITQTSVIFSLVNVDPGSTMVTVTAAGSAVYDSNTGLASVTLDTSATWPYQVDSISMAATPSPNTAVVSTDLFYDTTSVCTNKTNTACKQQYIMRINPNSGCNLGGVYVFNITLVCRSNACTGTYNSGSYQLRIYDTDVCGVDGTDVSLSNGQLLPFSDSAGTTAASTFVPDDVVYFSFTLESDSVTIDSMLLEKITAATSSTTDVLYDLHPTSGSAGVQTKGTLADLVITPAVTPTSPGVDCTIWFAVKLTDAISSFRVLPSATTTVTLSVIVDLTYHGNSKRSVEATYSTSVSSSAGQSELYIAQAASSGDSLVAENAGSSLSPYSPILLIVLAFVMFVLKH